MKKLVFTIALAGFSSVAIAQVQKTPNQTAQMETRKAEMQEKRVAKQEAHLAQMRTDFNLNDAQVEKISKMQNEMRATRQQEMMVRKEMNTESSAKMKAQQQMMNTEMKAILTPDQYKKWEVQKVANQKKRSEKMQNRKGEMMQKRKGKKADIK